MRLDKRQDRIDRKSQKENLKQSLRKMGRTKRKFCENSNSNQLQRKTIAFYR